MLAGGQKPVAATPPRRGAEAPGAASSNADADGTPKSESRPFPYQQTGPAMLRTLGAPCPTEGRGQARREIS